MFLHRLSKNNIFRAVMTFFALFVSLYADVASAQNLNLSTVASTVTQSGTSLVTIAKIGAGVVGFILVLAGVNGIVQAKKRQEGMGVSVVTALIGAALLSGSTLAYLGSNSVLGGSAMDSTTTSLGIN